jgi:nitrite reductase/ring-hydroxylating ferredoxin subunit
MVSRHAFRGAGTKWIKLDTGDVRDLATIPEATPTKAKAGINDLVLIRVADTIHAMHAVCSHAGGPLAQGKVVDGCVECPWHGSRFRMTDGHVRRGPALYDQPSYEIRAAEGGGYEVRRITS